MTAISMRRIRQILPAAQTVRPIWRRSQIEPNLRYPSGTVNFDLAELGRIGHGRMTLIPRRRSGGGATSTRFIAALLEERAVSLGSSAFLASIS